MTTIEAAAKAAEEKWNVHQLTINPTGVVASPVWNELPFDRKLKLTIIELAANPSDAMVEAVASSLKKDTLQLSGLRRGPRRVIMAINAISAAFMAAVKE